MWAIVCDRCERFGPGQQSNKAGVPAGWASATLKVHAEQQVDDQMTNAMLCPDCWPAVRKELT